MSRKHTAHDSTAPDVAKRSRSAAMKSLEKCDINLDEGQEYETDNSGNNDEEERFDTESEDEGPRNSRDISKVYIALKRAAQNMVKVNKQASKITYVNTPEKGLNMDTDRIYVSLGVGQQ